MLLGNNNVKKQLKDKSQNYNLANNSAFSARNLATNSSGNSLKSTNFLFSSYFS